MARTTIEIFNQLAEELEYLQTLELPIGFDQIKVEKTIDYFNVNQFLDSCYTNMNEYVHTFYWY